MALIEHTIAGAQDSALLWSKDSYESNFLETSLLFEGILLENLHIPQSQLYIYMPNFKVTTFLSP